MQTKIIKFLYNYAPYIKGECAGFPKARADHLIEQGIAEATTAIRDKDATKLKALAGAPETRDVKGPQATKTTKPTATKKKTTTRRKTKNKKS